MPHKLACLGIALVLALASSNRTSADEAIVRQAIQQYVIAFNEKDADAVAAMWSPNATHVDQSLGEKTDGRDAIMADIKSVFESNQPCVLSGTVDRVRMITPAVASVSGEVLVTVGDEEPSANRYSAILVNADDKWMIDSMEETQVVAPDSSAAALTKLDWMIGSWEDVGDEVTVRMTVSPSLGGQFLIQSYQATTRDGDAIMSTQVIGWDARKNEICSWTFDADGSHGQGTWIESGDEWLIKSVQTLADGRLASGTFVIKPTGADTYSISLVGREIEGEPMPSMALTTVRRVTDEDSGASLQDDAAPQNEETIQAGGTP